MLLALSEVVPKMISLIPQRFKRLVLDSPSRPPRAHDLNERPPRGGKSVTQENHRGLGLGHGFVPVAFSAGFGGITEQSLLLWRGRNKQICISLGAFVIIVICRTQGCPSKIIGANR